MSNARIAWIDTCKGLGILLVVLGHTRLQGTLSTYIYSFHMPLFFFLSGSVFVTAKYSNTFNLIKSKVKSLLIPYTIFSIISIGITIFFLIHGGNKNTISISSFFIDFIVSKRDGVKSFNNSLWFLTCLFLVELIYYLINKKINNKVMLLTTSLFISFIFALNAPFFHDYGLAWSLEYAIYYLFFFALGNFIKNLHSNKMLLFNKKLFLILFMAISIIIYTDLNNIKFIYHYSFLQYYIVPLMGIYIWIQIAKQFANLSILKYFGTNSLIILGLHMPICLNAIVPKIIKIFNLNISNSYNLKSFIITIMSMIILIPIIHIRNNYIPKLIGSSKKNHTLPYSIHNEF